MVNLIFCIIFLALSVLFSFSPTSSVFEILFAFLSGIFAMRYDKFRSNLYKNNRK